MEPDGKQTIRTFSTGATRDTENGKYEYGGFLSPLALRRYAAYMHQHRIQADGKLRSSSNWKKGIPEAVYLESLLRHVMDLWLHHDGVGEVARESVDDALCGILFNAFGTLHERQKAALASADKPI